MTAKATISCYTGARKWVPLERKPNETVYENMGVDRRYGTEIWLNFKWLFVNIPKVRALQPLYFTRSAFTPRPSEFAIAGNWNWEFMERSQRNRFIVLVVSGYLVFGVLWITLSDRLLLAFTDIEALTRLSMVKGVTFILLTSIFLLLSLRIIPDRGQAGDSAADISPAMTTMADRLPRWVGYFFAIAVTWATLILRMKIAVSFANRPLLILFMMPIILSSLLGGLGPGLVATFIAALGVNYYAIPNVHSFRIAESHDFFQWFIMIFSGILTSALSEMLHRSRRKSEERRAMQEAAQNALKISEERFNLAMKGSNDGVWDWDVVKNEFYLSPRWMEMIGYGENELVPNLRTWRDITFPDDREMVIAKVNDIFEGRSDRFEVEYRLRHRDGHYCDILSRAFPVRDGSGRIVRLVGTHVDVSDRRKAERIIMEREALLDQTSRMAKVGGWGFDVMTGQGWWTDEVARIHDFDPGEATSVTIGLSVYRGKHREKVERTLNEAIANATPFDIEVEMISAKGTPKWVRSMGTPVVAHGKVVKMEGIYQDITERKKAEIKINELNAELEQRVELRTAELVAANAELESFTYAVSHDLRGPLRAMSGFSSALIEDYGANLAGQARVYLDQIIEGSRKMGELIDGLLTLSRSTQSRIEPEQVNLSRVAERLLGEMRASEPERKVEWHVEPDLVALGDPVMLESVLENLLSNAWKYTSRKERATIRFFSRVSVSDRMFCVSDNGSGFDESYAHKLFEPFQRLHRQEEFPGIGIGLATAYRIIRRHGGTLSASGVKDKGAEFCFSVPDFMEKKHEGLHEKQNDTSC
jgi:PAS domain S-box-containing protein